MKNFKQNIAIAFFILAATLAGAAETQETEGGLSISPLIIVSAVALALLFYSYKIQLENSKLKNDIKKYKTVILGYIQERDGKYEPINSEGSKPKKPEKTSMLDSKENVKEDQAKKIYWERLSSTLDKTSPGVEELGELNSRKKDLEDLVELTKKKYHKREIDEKSFSEIIREQQRQIIEIEAKIEKLNKKD